MNFDQQKSASKWQRASRVLAWAVGVPLWALTLLTSLSVLNAANRYTAKDGYKEAVFVVTGASATGRLGKLTYFDGLISGQPENYVDPASSALGLSTAELLKKYPPGTAIPVKFNEKMRHGFIQYETLRVIDAKWDFAQDKALLLYFLYALLAPSAMVIAFLYFTRSWRQRPVAR
jgi:hypothetical protein